MSIFPESTGAFRRGYTRREASELTNLDVRMMEQLYYDDEGLGTDKGKADGNGRNARAQDVAACAAATGCILRRARRCHIRISEPDALC